MQDQSLEVEFFSQTPFDTQYDTPHLIPDQFLMKLSNLQTATVDQLPNLIEKVLSDEEPNDIELQQLSDVDLAILMKVKDKSLCSAKRPDELQKMFFKRAVKHAQKIFFKRKKSKRMNAFYKHYFQDAAEKLECSILNFYHPNKQIKTGSQTGQKSFNATYIKLIISSGEFRKVCREYMKEFVKDSIKERKTKIRKLVQTCRKLGKQGVGNEGMKQDIFVMKDEDYQKHLGIGGKEQMLVQMPSSKYYYAKISCIQRLEIYFKSSKCKIPWKNKDIELAYKCAEETIENFTANGD